MIGLPEIRRVKMEVTADVVGYSLLWNWEAKKYYNVDDKYEYFVPTYRMYLCVQCADGGWKRVGNFEVIRFGIKDKFEAGSHTGDVSAIKGYGNSMGGGLRARIETYNAKYRLHSTNETVPSGGFWIMEDYLVHKGPDNPRAFPAQMGGSGCIEVCRGSWPYLKELVLEASGIKHTKNAVYAELTDDEKLNQFCKAGPMNLRIELEDVKVPAL